MDGHTFRPETLLPTTPGVSFRHHILHVQNSTDPVTSMDTTTTTTTKQEPKETTNSLGIPAAQFVEDVDKYMKEQEGEIPNAEIVIRKFDEQHNKYRFMEMNLSQKKRRLKKQIPDIKASLDVLKLIRSRKEAGQEMDSNFLLSDDVFMQAKIPPTDKINLWLGANVMLEYSIEEADALLSKNLESANRNLTQIDIDLDYLRDQITTTEVNMARVYNWDVKRRQQDKLKSSAQ